MECIYKSDGALQVSQDFMYTIWPLMFLATTNESPIMGKILSSRSVTKAGY